MQKKYDVLSLYLFAKNNYELKKEYFSLKQKLIYNKYLLILKNIENEEMSIRNDKIYGLISKTKISFDKDITSSICFKINRLIDNGINFNINN